jgi:hypothetical protein
MNLGLHPNTSQRPLGGRVRLQRCHLNALIDQARDNANDLREVYLPDALAIKYPDARATSSGNISSRSPNVRLIRAAKKYAAIILIPLLCSAPSGTLPKKPVLQCGGLAARSPLDGSCEP